MRFCLTQDEIGNGRDAFKDQNIMDILVIDVPCLQVKADDPVILDERYSGQIRFLDLRKNNTLAMMTAGWFRPKWKRLALTRKKIQGIRFNKTNFIQF